MNQVVAGYTLPEGATAEDLDHWKPFCEWFEREYGYEPRPRDSKDKETFEAFLAGAYYEFSARTLK